MALVTSIQTLDESILVAVHGAPSWAVPLFYGFTTIGAGWGLLCLLPFLLRPRWRRETAWCLMAILTTSLVTSVVKDIVMRVRPCNALAWCAPLVISTPDGFSFPSGHASGSFAFAAFVAVRRPRFAALTFAYASLVAWSRCVLGAHYPSDVLAGALLGATIGGSFATVFTKRARTSSPPTSAEAKNEAVASSEPRVS